jgi:hypothetical protein
VHEVLTNEKYIGNNVYNRISFKLKKLRVVNTPDMWIEGRRLRPPSFRPMCSTPRRASSEARARRYTDEELIERLRGLYQNRGIPVRPDHRRNRGHAVGVGLRASFRQPDPRLPDGGLHARSRLPVPGDQPLPAPPIPRSSNRREARSPAWAARWSAIRPPTCCASMTSSGLPGAGQVPDHESGTPLEGALRHQPEHPTSPSPCAWTPATRRARLLPVAAIGFRTTRISLAERNAIEFESYRFETLGLPLRHGVPVPRLRRAA